VVASGRIVFQHDQGVRARAGLALAAVDGASDRLSAVVIKNQVRMSSRSVEPALDAVPGLGDGFPNGALGGGPIGIGGSPGNVSLFFQAGEKLIIGSANVLAQDVPTKGLVLTEIARGTALTLRQALRGAAGTKAALSVQGTVRCSACPGVSPSFRIAS
jgi:hypothetical protein